MFEEPEKEKPNLEVYQVEVEEPKTPKVYSVGILRRMQNLKQFK
jgi:hypothetical protein